MEQFTPKPPPESGPRVAAVKVSVVIPVWKRSDLLRACLQSLRQQSETPFSVVIVSNGAGAEVERLAKEYACKLVILSENRGFAAGVNAGIRATSSTTTTAPYVAVLNDDVRLHPDWLKHLTAWLDEHPETSFCCGKILLGDGALIDSAGDALSAGGAAWRLGHGAVSLESAETPHPLLAASWTAALLRRSAIERAGGLDEEFFAYLEDVDFAVRCAREGLRGQYLPQALAWHQGGASSGGAESEFVIRQLTRNQLLLLAKDFPVATLLRYGPRIAWTQVLWAMMAVRKGRLRAWLSGISQFLRALPRALGNRLHWDAPAQRAFREWLRQGEAAIYADQFSRQRPAPDTFWRMYFALFRPAPRDLRLASSDSAAAKAQGVSSSSSTSSTSTTTTRPL